MSLALNGITASSMRFLASWNGVWTAEIELEPGSIVPTGRAVAASTEGLSLVGTVDDEHSGTFADKAHALLVGGGAGWRKPVRAQHYHSDIGLQISAIATTTAAEVGEVVTVLAPKIAGLDFARRADTASLIFSDPSFSDLDWWVGLDGVTRVGLRPPVPSPADLRVLDWHPETSTMSFTCGSLVEPGTIIIDERFGRRVARKVEATVSNGSITGTIWAGDAGAATGTVDIIHDSIAAIARDATRIEHARFYEYQVIAMQGDRVELHALNASDGVPDLIPASIWSGLSGYKAALRPSSSVLVGFRGGDPKKPFVAFYEPPENDGWRPLELTIDSLEKLTIGGAAASVILGVAGGALPVARAPAIQAFGEALGKAVAVAATAAAANAGPISGAQIGTILTALAKAFDAASTTMKETLPSTKVQAS